MADIKLLTDVDSLDLEAAITQVVNGESDDFLEIARTLGLNPFTDFKGRDLSGISLEPGSDLEGANFSEVTFSEAKLEGVYLRSANLSEAVLEDTDLRRANLHFANLERAKLNGANFEGADFFGANLTLADFRGAYGLTTKQTKEAKNWQLAHYDPAFRQALGLPPEAPNQ